MKKILLAAGALLGAALAQTSCQAPAPPAPKAEPIAVGKQSTAHKPAPTTPTNQPAAKQKAVVELRPIYPALYRAEKPHLRKVKYGKRRWVLV